MTLGERIAAEALRLVGVPFRLYSQTEESGLDCVGLATLAMRRAGASLGPLPVYRMRGMSIARVETLLRSAGLEPATDDRPGDILVCESGPMQLHLMIATNDGCVHAHAGLGRVVLMPTPAPGPLLGRWRGVEQISETN
jgi:lipoprotein Spr